MKTLSILLTLSLSHLSLSAFPLVNFETHGGQTSCGTIPVSENLLATLAVFGSKPDTATLATGAESENPTKLNTIFNNRTTSLVFLEHRTPTAELPPLGESVSLASGSPLFLDPKEPATICRVVSREYHNRGDILPVSFLRIHYPGKTIPPVGTALYNKKGEVCAIVHQPAPSYGNGSYALPIEAVKKFLASHKTGTANARCWIGVAMEASNTVPQIVSVRPASPAAESGLKKGDIILKIGKRNISKYAEAVDAFFYFIAGEEIQLTVLRGVDEKVLTVTPEISPLAKKAE